MHNGSLVCVHVDCMISSPFINQSSSQKRERSDMYCNCMSQLLKRECENSLFQMDFSDKTQNEDAHSVHQSSGYPLSHTVTCESICQPYTHLFIHPVMYLYVISSNAVDKSSRPISTGSSILIPFLTMYQKLGKLNNRGLLTVIYLPFTPSKLLLLTTPKACMWPISIM